MNLLWLLWYKKTIIFIYVQSSFFSRWHHQATGRRLPSGSPVKLISLNICYSWSCNFIWNPIKKINTFVPGECRSWLSKAKLWNGRPGTLSSPSCLPSMTPCSPLLLSRTMWETNFVSGCLECSMRSGLLLVSSPFLDPHSGRPFRYCYWFNQVWCKAEKH